MVLQNQMKIFTSKTQKIGEIGEDIAEKFLVKSGFTIVERNYTRKWGEIDVIAKKGGISYFFEVKSVSCEIIGGVPRVTIDPEENLHPRKLKRLGRVIQSYLAENNLMDSKFESDALIVFIDLGQNKSVVKVIKDIFATSVMSLR